MQSRGSRDETNPVRSLGIEVGNVDLGVGLQVVGLATLGVHVEGEDWLRWRDRWRRSKEGEVSCVCYFGVGRRKRHSMGKVFYPRVNAPDEPKHSS